MSVKKLCAAIAAGLLAISLGNSSAAFAEKPEALPTVVSSAAVKVFLNKQASRTASPQISNLKYNGGPVMTNAVVVRPIYWGLKFANNPDYTNELKAAMSSLYNNYSGSNHAKISQQYTQTGGLQTSTTVSATNPYIDVTAAKYTKTADISAEVLKAYGTELSNDAYYPVYTDIPRGTATFCAWHSYATTNTGKVIKFAFFFDLTNDAQCSVPMAANSWSQPVQNLANVSIHEIAEAMTDPKLNAWYDKFGAENADKCAWKFGSGSVTLSNSTVWSLQGEWSNAISGCAW